jgi:uncharacterized protein YggU (UPF0235/DUF167 family)
MALSQTIAVRLTPKASSDRVGGTRKLPNGDEQLVVYVTAAPDNGKANEAMIRLLAKHLGVGASRLTIMHGQTNRNKLVRIE